MSDQWRCALCRRAIRAGKQRKDSRLWKGSRAHSACITARRRITSGTTQPSSSTLLSEDWIVRRHLQLFDWTIIPASDRSLRLTHLVAQRRPRNAGVSIDGNAKQKGLDTIPEFDPIASEWEAVVREAASRAGVDTESLFVVDQKILTSAPGKGQQAVHWDCERILAAGEKFTCLLVCSNGHFSTALPAFPANRTLSFSHDSMEMRSVSHLLASEHYVSHQLFPGYVIIFRQSTPHFGVTNTCHAGDRVLLFSVLSPSNSPGQDQEQVMPWLFVRHAFGEDSKEYAQALVQFRLHHPIFRLQGDDAPAAQAALNCLRSHALYDAYHSKSSS